MYLSELDASTTVILTMCSKEGSCNFELGHSMPYQQTKVQSANQTL
jgi:hypothetical protein